MSKKQKELNTQIQAEESEKQNQISEGVIETGTSKTEEKTKKSKADNKNNKKKDKKKKEKTGGLVKKTKETMSELKKVTWPTFGEVVKKTGIVIAFVVIFGLFLFGVNSLLTWLVRLLAGV